MSLLTYSLCSYQGAVLPRGNGNASKEWSGKRQAANAEQVEAFASKEKLCRPAHKEAKGKCGVSRSIFRTETKNFRWLSCGVPPVLIPNTEVKPTYTDSTVLETAWEDRQLPDPNERATHLSRSFALQVCTSE